MAKNLVEQVKSIEGEAERTVSEAWSRAKEAEESVAAETAALRKQHEEAFARDLEAFRSDLERQTAEQEAALDRKAAQIAGALESLEPEAVAQAVRLILGHLRGE